MARLSCGPMRVPAARRVLAAIVCISFTSWRALGAFAEGAREMGARELEPRELAPPRAGLRVAAVQLLVSERDVSSLPAFREHVRRAARDAVAAGANLIVFPEYTGALLALVPWAWAIEGSTSATEALERIRRREPGIGSMRDLFLAGSDEALRGMGEIFGGLAAAHGLTVVAGSYFARGIDGAGNTVLLHRALVYAPDGRLLYSQDKVFLTEFEEEIGMLPGSSSAARPFMVERYLVGLTICRDTFLDLWERLYAGVDLWVDIKGNGEPYTPEVEERFTRALPARLRSSGVRAGLTVCLNGALLDFVWEGPSSAVRQREDGTIETLAAAHSARGEEVLVVDLAGP